MMNKSFKIQAVREWAMKKFFKEAEIFANWKDGQIIVETNSKDFPYAEIRIRPMTKEVGDELITETLERIQSYEEHKRNRFIAKLMREKEE